MIGSGLKKLAAENGMKVSNGVAYGALKGYATTMSEGAGYKMISISTRFTDAAQKDALIEYANERNLTKEFRVNQLSIAPNGIVVVFHDDPGTMKKIIAFIDWFYPLLPQYSATGDDICPECGLELVGGCWKLVNGMAVHVHQGCAQSLANKIEVKNEKRKTEGGGSYITGFIGALLGAIIGAILWGIVGSFGYISGIVAIVIGFLSEIGYRLLRGKKGKGKIAILIIVIIIGVVLGTFLGDAITIAQELEAAGMAGRYDLIPTVIMYALTDGSEYLTAVLGNLAIGLLFAGAGVYGIIRKASKEVADDKIVDLE